MFRNLHTRLAAVLLGLFLLIGVLYILLTLYTTRLYFQEVNQKLNRILAQHLVSEKVLMQNGRVNEAALRDIFHMLMVVNPVIEVYLLDTDGAILAYSAPPGKVKLRALSLDPVKELLAGTSALPVLGDDPRDPGRRKVFSAAPVSLDGRTEGYLYIILGGEEFESEARMLRGSYIIRLSMGAAVGGLLFTLAAALLLFNRMTRPLRRLTASMEAFRESGFSGPPEALKRRPPARQGNEIDRLGEIFSQMADRIAAQIQALRTEDRLRREFTATITHDLRTPLTSLQGYLETLLMKEAELTPDERRGYLITAVRRSEQLGKLVASLFDLARLDAPGFEPRFEPFSLAELVQDILQKFRLAAEKKKVGLRMDVPEELPRAQADIGLVERVFENLIGNALRYTPENGTISVSAAPEEERISVMVSDTGPGIPPEDLAGLFDRHRRRAKADHHAGAGLGLAIAKRIIELHGGGIKVRSEARTGTAFTFSLPRSRESRSFAPPVP